MSQIVTQLYVEIFVIVVGAVVTIVLPYIAWRLRKQDRLDVAVFGVDGVDEIDGLVGTIEMHDQELEEHDNRISNNRKDIKYMEKKMDSIHERIDEVAARSRKRKEDNSDEY